MYKYKRAAAFLLLRCLVAYLQQGEEHTARIVPKNRTNKQLDVKEKLQEQMMIMMSSIKRYSINDSCLVSI